MPLLFLEGKNTEATTIGEIGAWSVVKSNVLQGAAFTQPYVQLGDDRANMKPFCGGKSVLMST